MNTIRHNLMAPVGETQGGSGGETALFTSPTGGGTPNPAPGSQGAASSVPPGTPPGGNPANPNPQNNEPPNWRASLPKELQDDPSLSKFTSVDTLAKSYLNAQKLIGADKISVPNQYTTEDQWKEIYTKLGVPETIDKYEVKFKEGASIDADFTKQFIENSHKLGIHPKQAQGLADWFSAENMKAESDMTSQIESKFRESMKGLQTEWGNAYDLNIARANKVVQEIGGKELYEHYQKMGIGTDVPTLKFLAKLGETLFKEHKFVEGQGTSTAMTPKELDQQISKLMSDPAYFDAKHPQNKVIVAQVQELFASKNGAT